MADSTEPAGVVRGADTAGAPPRGDRQASVAGVVIAALGIWTALTVSVITLIALHGAPPNTRAVMLMGATLAVTWILVGGLLQWRLRDRFRGFFQRLPGPWQLRFVLFSTGFALLEEAITTGLTNLAALFGVPYGHAYITASGNYLDVVCLHSVVVFVPMFVFWAWLLSRYDFHPSMVFVLFGLTGTLAEVSFGGVGALLNVGFWSYIYGLMIYLPGYSVPERARVRQPGPGWYLGAVFLPFLCAAPVAGIVGALLHPIRIHFPPIPPNS